MTINSLLSNFSGLKCTVKHSQLRKLVAYEMLNSQFTKFISLLCIIVLLIFVDSPTGLESLIAGVSNRKAHIG